MLKHITHLILSFALLFACDSDEVITVDEHKLDYYLESYEIPDLGFQPQSKVTYEYAISGNLSEYHVLTYNPDSKSFEEQRYFKFIYSDNKVSEIKGYSPDAASPYLQYTYTYLPDGRVSNIKETNTNSIDSEANFAYDDTANTTKVSYAFSNGTSFEYEFLLKDGNLISDKTTRGSQLCSEGQYTYDNHVNPFAKFGYVDYLLTNLSSNNRISESINHINCSFPSFIPESYLYEYDDQGYPTVATTFYKSGSTVARSKKEFFYKATHR